MAFALFAVWANLHAGFLYGLVLIGFYLAGDLVALLLERHRADYRMALRRHAWLFGAAVAGSCLNPRGPLTILHVAGYLRLDFLLDMTAEMRSPDFHRWYGRVFLIALLLVLAALALVRRRMRWPHLVVLLGTTAFALQAVRNIPLWALTGFLLAVLHANEGWRGIPWAPLARIRAAFASGAALARAGLWSLVPALVLIALALAGGRVSGIQLLPDRFDSTVFPVKLVERARAAGVTGRMFNEFAWGGYILYAWPEQRVFIDGQTDFYGVRLSRLYVSLRDAEPGWEQRLDSLGVTMVLLPRNTPLARRLAASPMWMARDSADRGVFFISRRDRPR